MRATPDNSGALRLIALLLAAAWAGGCGGGEAHLTRAQYVARGEAICEDAQVEEVKLAARYGKEAPDTVKSRPDLLVAPAVVPPLAKELRRLEALNPPQADAGKIQAILEEMEMGIKDAEADPIDLLVEETDPFARANGLAAEYGLRVCARSSHAVVHP